MRKIVLTALVALVATTANAGYYQAYATTSISGQITSSDGTTRELTLDDISATWSADARDVSFRTELAGDFSDSLAHAFGVISIDFYGLTSKLFSSVNVAAPDITYASSVVTYKTTAAITLDPGSTITVGFFSDLWGNEGARGWGSGSGQYTINVYNSAWQTISVVDQYPFSGSRWRTTGGQNFSFTNSTDSIQHLDFYYRAAAVAVAVPEPSLLGLAVCGLVTLMAAKPALRRRITARSTTP